MTEVAGGKGAAGDAKVKVEEFTKPDEVRLTEEEWRAKMREEGDVLGFAVQKQEAADAVTRAENALKRAKDAVAAAELGYVAAKQALKELG